MQHYIFNIHRERKRERNDSFPFSSHESVRGIGVVARLYKSPLTAASAAEVRDGEARPHLPPMFDYYET